MNIFVKFQIGYCYDTCKRSSVFAGEIIADISNVFLALFCSDVESFNSGNSQTKSNKHGEQTNFMYFACKNTRNDCKVCCSLVRQKSTKISGTNQKPERPRLFETGLVRYCPQGHFSLFFTKDGTCPPLPTTTTPPDLRKSNSEHFSQMKIKQCSYCRWCLPTKNALDTLITIKTT